MKVSFKFDHYHTTISFAWTLNLILVLKSFKIHFIKQTWGDAIVKPLGAQAELGQSFPLLYVTLKAILTLNSITGVSIY